MTKLLGYFALAAISITVAPQALKAADADALCPAGNATKHGIYMSHAEGTVLGVGPIAAVGWIAYDGKGNFVNTYTISVNGMISRNVTVTGTYTVNSDCTGSESASDGSHFESVVAPNGSTFNAIKTDPTAVVSREADASGQCPAGNATLHGAYMSQGSGSIMGVGHVSVVGVMTFDGKGNGALNSTLSVNGAISQATLSGAYTVNSDCTMTLTFSNGTHYDGMVGAEGNLTRWIETDPGTVISGTTRRIGHQDRH